MTAQTKLDADVAKISWKRVHSLADQLGDILRDLESAPWCHIMAKLQDRALFEMELDSAKVDAPLRKAGKI